MSDFFEDGIEKPVPENGGGGGKHRIRESSCLPPSIDAGLDLEALSLAHSFLLRNVTFFTLTLTNRLLVVKITLGLFAPKRQSMKLAQVREFGLLQLSMRDIIDSPHEARSLSSSLPLRLGLVSENRPTHSLL